MLRVRSTIDTEEKAKPTHPPPIPFRETKRYCTTLRAKRLFRSPQPRLRLPSRTNPLNLPSESTKHEKLGPIAVKTRKKALHSLRPKSSNVTKLSRIRSFLQLAMSGPVEEARNPHRFPFHGAFTPTRTYQSPANKGLREIEIPAACFLSSISGFSSSGLKPRLERKGPHGLRVNTDPEGISAWDAETEGRPSSNLR